jgi:hypothetical protein
VNRIRPFFIGVLSAGWVLPLCLVGTNYVAYLRTELEPKITGHPPTHSFPILDVCLFWLITASVWLAVVIICWSIYFLRGKT